LVAAGDFPGAGVSVHRRGEIWYRIVNPPTTMSLQAAEARSPDALEGIYTAHFDAVWHHLRRMGISEADREDLAQEVFLIVHRRLPSYDPSRPMRAWLIGIATRVALHYWRSARRRPGDKIASPSELELAAAIAVGETDHDARELLNALLATLDHDRRATFLLHEVEGFTVPEIAELTETPLNTVYSRIKRTRDELAALATRLAGRGTP
jgi:RNA polymerase sigma-70 factor (ECF subfamily)